MVRLLASGLAQVSGVELLDGGVLVGFADGVGHIRIVQNLGAQRADVRGVAHVTGLLGLSAAVDTAAGTSHDLDKVVVGLAGFYLFQQFLGVAEAGGNRDLHIHARHVVGGFLDACGAADFREVELGQLLAGQGLHCGS